MTGVSNGGKKPVKRIVAITTKLFSEQFATTRRWHERSGGIRLGRLLCRLGWHRWETRPIEDPVYPKFDTWKWCSRKCRRGFLRLEEHK